MPTSFFVRKRNHGEECLPKHKGPLSLRLLLNVAKSLLKVGGMHFAPFLFYLELDRVFVMIISSFTLLVWLVMIKY